MVIVLLNYSWQLSAEFEIEVLHVIERNLNKMYWFGKKLYPVCVEILLGTCQIILFYSHCNVLYLVHTQKALIGGYFKLR